jgi:hypothetical protein
MGEAKRRVEKKTANGEDPGRDEIAVVGVIEGLRVGTDPVTDQVVGALAWIKTAVDEMYVVVAKDDEPRAVLLALYVGAAARFTGQLSPAPDFPEFKGVIASSAITPVERDEIVMVATVETIKRAWSDGDGIRAAWAYVITKDQDRFTVLSRGGEAMNALLSLNPADVARFTGRFSPPFDTVPNIELSLVVVIERSGRVEAWREQWFFVPTDRLSPDFRGRVASCRTQNCECSSCGTTIVTADQIGLVLLRNCMFRVVCVDCGALPRDELVEKLSVFEGKESDQVLFVENATKAERAIARCCGLGPEVAVDWSVDGECDYGPAGKLRPIDEPGVARFRH